MYILTILIMFFTLFLRAEKRCKKLISYPLFLNNILNFNKLTKNNCFNKYKNKFQRKYHIKNKMENQESPFIAVYVTTPSKEVAEKISYVLLEEKLVSCVNIIPGILSLYHWKGEIAKDNEVLMMIKTKKHLFEEIVKFVKSNHPYEIPEVIAVPIEHGSKDYLDWVNNSVKKI
ncbi:putative cutA [Plasmodium gaboni]|uniref:Putative cutA n=1 Tax=Plasmodium gaboni TaxID=647221 RepID=A0A151LH96_9APIC|nr:putative cutA [Plasmodium gaboni]KYN98276.1 putative cutA [Plasmodium gaboni]